MPLTPRKILTLLLFCLCALPAFPAVFTVTSNADNGPGTLRDAITQAAANGTTSTDYINFNFSDLSMAGRTITLLTELPVLSSNLVIDGTTQPGTPFFTTDAHVFICMMTYVTSFSMLKVYNCTAVQIYGLYLYYGDWADAVFPSPGHFRQHTLYGIDISNSSYITIGAPGKGNVLNGEAKGIWSADNTPLTHDITIQSNYIACDLSNNLGTGDPDNFIYYMEQAISLLNVKNITIGGPSAAQGNVLSGAQAVWISSSAITGNGSLLIQNNHFYRWYDKTTLYNLAAANNNMGFSPSGQYVYVFSNANQMDYSVQFLDNDIPEVVDFDNLSIPFVVSRNRFGEVPQITQPNDAKLFIYRCWNGGTIGSDNLADANQFLFGQADRFAVRIADSGPVTNWKNIYECNSFYGSTISVDSIEEPYSVPQVQVNQPSPTAIAGSATPNCRIDLYYDDECTACEGKIYIGKTQSDASGSWTYGGPVNGTIVATATNSLGRTSDFSEPRFSTGSMKIIPPSCGNANGSITGITSDGAEAFYWQNESTGAIVSHSIDLTNMPPGGYLLYGVHGGTCIRSVGQTYYLEDVTPHIQAAFAVVTQPGCGQFNGAITNITVSEYSNLQFSWIDAQGHTVSNQQDLTNVGPGNYKLVVKDAVTGCSDQTGFYSLINQSGPTVDISQAQIAGTICRQPTGSIGNILITNVTGQPTYTWIDASGTPVGSQLALQNVPPGNYKLIFKDQGSCPAITTPAFTIPNTGGDLQLTADNVSLTDESCERKDGSIQVLHISPTDAGFGFSFVDESTGQTIGTGTSISGLPAGLYSFQATDATGCPQKVAAYQLKDDPAPAIDLSKAEIDPDLCSQQMGAISGIAIQGTPSFTYSWYDAAGTIVGNTKDLTSLGKGGYYLVVTDKNNCSSTGPVLVIDNTNQQLNTPLYDDVVIPKGRTATITVKNPDKGTYELYPIDPALASPAPVPVQKNSDGNFTTAPLDADTTLYVLLRKGDCSSAVAAVNIKVLLTQELIVPNAFTPNADGHNDLFRVKNPQLVRTFSLAVFDRWGQKVFESADAYKGWDATFNGHSLPAGTYVWGIHYTDILGNTLDRRGTVMLIR